MAIRQIRLNGDEILRKKAREVDTVDDKIRELLHDMLETMHKYNGVGLAGPQVGILKRVIVIDLYDGEEPLLLVNPKIIKSKGKQEVDEGCLSFPNEYAKIIRPKEVVVEALNENGEKVKIEDILSQKNLVQSEVQNKITDTVTRAKEEAEILVQSGYSVYSRDLGSDIYKLTNISNYLLGANGELYIIFAYGNQNHTSEMDIVLYE